MSMLDGLFGFRTILVNGVEMLNRARVNFIGASGSDDGTTLSLQIGGLALTAVKAAPYGANYGEHVRSNYADVTLPLAASQKDGRVGVLLTTTNAIVISRSGSDTINGATTLALTTAYDSVILQSDGVDKWYIVGRVNAGV
jgi:hypothetical protein